MPEDPRSTSTINDRIRLIVKHAAHLLPIQGPIGVFIHHNTLHSLQHLPFESAVLEGSRLFETEPYMREVEYRAALDRGRILEEDIYWVLEREPNDVVAGGITDRRALRLQMLVPGIGDLCADTIQWQFEENVLPGMSEQDHLLFQACLERTPYCEPARKPASLRLRDNVLACRGIDIDSTVNSFLTRVCAAFLDQGLAYWPMPDRNRGLYHASRDLWRRNGAIEPEHLQGLREAFNSQAENDLTAEDVVLAALQRTSIPELQWEDVISAELLALPGWPGLLNRLAEEPGLAAHERVPCSLMDYLAVRLTLNDVAAGNAMKSTARDHWNERVPGNVEEERLVHAVRLCKVAKLLGMTPAAISTMEDAALASLRSEINAFDDVERRRIFHLSYERHHERQILGPLSAYRQSTPLTAMVTRPSAQVFFCLDEREESIRRHIEELDPSFETLSAAGFYSVAVDYAGIDDAHGVPLCPVVVKPKHAVRERPAAEHEELYHQRRALRSMWARLAHNFSVSSRTLVRGAFSTAVLGILSIFPLIAHILTPRRYNLLMRALNRSILPEPRTELTLMRQDPQGHQLAEDLLLGFSNQEKIERVASVLGPAGLYTRFARLVFVFGHGSTSLNNPHESAHDCGACGGRRGGPNGRLFAAMANRPGVRAGLRELGIVIPDDTWFIGGYHDTCSDEIQYFDLDLLPATHREDYEAALKTLDQARALDAHERSRRFEACPQNASPAEALWHVQERSEHLAEPRPEYGHCTNAVTIVGRREMTRGLFFDRRAFLVSYDPTLDPTNANLKSLLGAAIPVCAGISLEYYFSFVDNERYGCGTKLPHNVAGLVGVMNGPESDLRTGLPWQMVEIHEPVRNLFVIETTPARLSNAIEGSPLLQELVNNRWIRLSTIDPDDGSVHVWRNGTFEPGEAWMNDIPQARTSMDFYRGKREHLPVARITGTHQLTSRRTA